MLTWQITSFISLLLFIWLGLRLLVAFTFWLYLWQRKEYRWDRFWAHLKLPEGRRQALSALNPLALILRKPQLTLRLLLVGFLSFLLDYQLYFSLLRWFSISVRRWPILLFPVFVIALLLVFWLTPLVITLANFLVGLFLWPLYSLLIFLASLRLKQISPLVIGITGSYGKTATKEILKEILKVKYRVLATQASINTPLGVARTILSKLRSQHEIFLVEMGAYRPGEIQALTRLVRPKIGILTGINPQHQQLFGTQEKIASTKYELVKSLPADGLAVFNGENPITASLAKKTSHVPVKLYFLPKKPYPTPLLGQFQQLNIQAALTVADFLGVARTQALAVVEQLSEDLATLKLRRGRYGCFVLDDSRNSNPDGFWEALNVLATFSGKKKLIITSGIIELGQAGSKVHRRLGAKISRVADKLILTSDNFLVYFLQGAGRSWEKKIEVISSRVALRRRLRILIDSETVVLIEGWNLEARRFLLPRSGSKL